MGHYLILSLLLSIMFVAIAPSNLDMNDSVKDHVIEKIVIGSICFLILGIINYSIMPVLSIWGYNGIWIEATVIALLGGLGRLLDEESSTRSKYLSAIPFGVCLVAFFVMFFQTYEICQADKYQQLLKVTEVKSDEFSEKVKGINLEKMISVDAGLAQKVADEMVSQYPEIASSSDIGNFTIQNFTGEFIIDGGKKVKFEEELIWVAPLEHKSVIKWFKNEVTKGYVIVSALDKTKRHIVTQLNGEPIRLKYVESALFADDIERYTRTHGFSNEGLTDFTFEIDPSGRPYWCLSAYKNMVGFNGREIKNVITVDPQTGELKEYKQEDAPKWIDRIQPEDIITEQITWWGKYKEGWTNGVFTGNNLLIPTKGISLVYSEGNCYWYTGIQSDPQKSATTGFMLVNSRTKEAFYYKGEGIHEAEAIQVANCTQFTVEHKCTANFPVLYNINGIPTYFMIYKNQSGNLAGYCMMSSENRDVYGCGATKAEAQNEYFKALKRIEGIIQEDEDAEKHICHISRVTYEDGSYFLILEEFSGYEFVGTSSFFREIKWAEVGRKVEISFQKLPNREENKDVVLTSYDDLELDLDYHTK